MVEKQPLIFFIGKRTLVSCTEETYDEIRNQYNVSSVELTTRFIMAYERKEELIESTQTFDAFGSYSEKVRNYLKELHSKIKWGSYPAPVMLKRALYYLDRI